MSTCYGWQRLVKPTRCYSPPKWQAGKFLTCGLHLSAAIREQIESGADEVVTRRIQTHVRGYHTDEIEKAT